MFDLIRPCNNCPFRNGAGRGFRLSLARLQEIFEAPAFQCHKTVDYDHIDDPQLKQGEKPQQCAGLMSLLYRAGRSNQIMQVGERFGAFKPDKLDHSDAYPDIAAAIKDHS